ncbi:MAG: hypothetical protein WCT44_01350 [Candidatus Paceibacterota bacterium]
MEYKNENRICQNCKNNFVIEPEDFNFYEKMQVPPPTFCPECRMQRRMAWRNERSFYHTKCAFSEKDLISGFSPESKIIVYDRDIWWSDKWDPMSYGVEYDFTKTFFSQFSELLHRTPMPAVFNARTINSAYSQHTGDFKNGYLIFASWGGENVSYGARSLNVKDSMDIFAISECELCYELVSAKKCYRVLFSENIEECNNSAFLYECRGCSDCFGCTNLRSKSYYIFNQPYSREAYLEKMKEFNLKDITQLKKIQKDFEELKKKTIRKYANITNAPMSTGDNITNSYNCKDCFDIYGEVKNARFVQNTAKGLRDTYDGYGAGAEAELLYEVFDTGVQGAKLCFVGVVYGGHDVYYSYNCHGSQDCFGCIGLRQKQYCILNKQYTKEEYNELLLKVIEHMNSMPYVDKKKRVYKYGEFFPVELSPFYYNETIATEFLPLNKTEVENLGFKWKENSTRDYKIEIENKDIPQNIDMVDESIIGRAISCLHAAKCNEQCTEAFKIVPTELQFYKKMNLALPRLCPNCRHYHRLKQRNPLKLWHRKCMCDKKHPNHTGKCDVEFETSYAPDRPEIVYCEKCYQQEVY